MRARRVIVVTAALGAGLGAASAARADGAYADGVKDPTEVDPGLPRWTITIKGTGPDGMPIDATAVTGAGGYWE